MKTSFNDWSKGTGETSPHEQPGSRAIAEAQPSTDSDVTAAAEYNAVFGDKPMHEVVLDVVCRAASLMGKVRGDNGALQDGYTNALTAKMGQEACQFVTHHIRVLFSESSTPKKHALAYHLAEEVLRRASLIEADTRSSEMLHEILEEVSVNAYKHPTSFFVQVMRCEMTFFLIVATDLKDA